MYPGCDRAQLLAKMAMVEWCAGWTCVRVSVYVKTSEKKRVIDDLHPSMVLVPDGGRFGSWFFKSSTCISLSDAYLPPPPPPLISRVGCVHADQII